MKLGSFLEGRLSMQNGQCPDFRTPRAQGGEAAAVSAESAQPGGHEAVWILRGDVGGGEVQ